MAQKKSNNERLQRGWWVKFCCSRPSPHLRCFEGAVFKAIVIFLWKNRWRLFQITSNSLVYRIRSSVQKSGIIILISWVCNGNTISGQNCSVIFHVCSKYRKWSYRRPHSFAEQYIMWLQNRGLGKILVKNILWLREIKPGLSFPAPVSDKILTAFFLKTPQICFWSINL